MHPASHFRPSSVPELQLSPYQDESISDPNRAHGPESSLVMAEQSIHDVVNHTLSAGDFSPPDVNEDQSTRQFTGEDVAVAESTSHICQGGTSDHEDGQAVQIGSTNYPIVNGEAQVLSARLPLRNAHADSIHEQNQSGRDRSASEDAFTQVDSNPQDSDFDGNLSRNQSVGDLSAASDTDGPKAEQFSVSEDIKNQDANNATKRPASFKPVSFAKYSAAKAVGNNSAAKSNADKGKSLGIAPAQRSTNPSQCCLPPPILLPPRSSQDLVLDLLQNQLADYEIMLQSHSDLVAGTAQLLLILCRCGTKIDVSSSQE